MNKDTVLKILEAASAAGFDNAGIVPWNGAAVLVLFWAYETSGIQESGRIGVSPYYTSSNTAYARAGELADKLCQMGLPAARAPHLPAKDIALLSGGFLGQNGFYFHEKLGSKVHIQTIALEAALLPDFQNNARQTKGCLGCRRCLSACPVGAISQAGVDYSKCVRKYLEQPLLPAHIKPYIYQLFGCEKCQSVCPLNHTEAKPQLSVDLTATIRGETISFLQEAVGKNIARFARVINQSIVYAANQGFTEAAAAVRNWERDSRFSDACSYYLQKTSEKDCT